MSGHQAVATVRTLLADDVTCRVAGGWGVDALAGRQMRDHLGVQPRVFGDEGLGVLRTLDDTAHEHPPAGLVTGVTAGADVPCNPARLQLQFHLRYAPIEKDRPDVAALAAAGPVGLVARYA